MPKRKEKFDQAAQSERFRKAAREMIDAGELNPIAGEKALDALVRSAKRTGPASNDEPRPDD